MTVFPVGAEVVTPPSQNSGHVPSPGTRIMRAYHGKAIVISAITACLAFWVAVALAIAEFLELIEF